MLQVHPLQRAAAVALLLVSACGGSGSDSSTPRASAPSATATSITTQGITLAEWQQQTTVVCEEYEPQQDAIIAAHKLGSPEDVIAFVDELTPVAERYLVALDAIAVPEERAGDVARLFELYDLNFEAAVALRAAAVRRDQGGLQAAAAELGAQATELMTLLADLGVPACV